MIVKGKADKAHTVTIVEVTPDDLMIAARRLHLEAKKAQPGQEIIIHLTPEIMLKYDPKITTADVANRHRVNLPGTDVSGIIDRSLQEQVRTEEVGSLPVDH